MPRIGKASESDSCCSLIPQDLIEEASGCLEDLRGHVVRRPMESVMIAFGVGALLGLVFGRSADTDW
jgi:hypothetical protein